MFFIRNTIQTSQKRIVKLIRVGPAMCSRMSAFDKVGIGTNPFLHPDARAAQKQKVSEIIARERRALAILRNNGVVLQRRQTLKAPADYVH